MESSFQRLGTTSSVASRLDALWQLGKDGGLGGVRIWWLLDGDNKRARTNHPTALTICDQLYISLELVKKELSNRWIKKFEDPSDLGKLFYVHTWKKSKFVTAREDNDSMYFTDMPQNGKIVTINSEEATAIRNIIFRNLQQDYSERNTTISVERTQPLSISLTTPANSGSTITSTLSQEADTSEEDNSSPQNSDDKTSPYSTPQFASSQEQINTQASAFCQGIQSELLNKYAQIDLGYCSKRWDLSKGEWRSNMCLRDGGDTRDTKGRCLKCCNAWKNIKKTTHPLLFELESKLKEEKRNELKECVSQRLKDVSDRQISTDQTLCEVVDMMKINQIEKLPLNSNKVFTFCAECNVPRLSRSRKDLSTLCRGCQKMKSNEQRRQHMREERFKDRTAPDSRVNFASLQPHEVKQRVKNLRIQRHNTSQIIKRLNERLKSNVADAKFSKKMTKQCEVAVKYARENEDKVRTDLKTEIFEILKELEKEMGSADEDHSISEEDSNSLINVIMDSMKNLIYEKQGHKNQCRYSPDLMGLAMGLYLRSPCGYKQFRDHSPIIFPAASTLAAIRQKQGIKDGDDCIEMYEDQHLVRKNYNDKKKKKNPDNTNPIGGNEYEEWGQIMSDEMKLQKDVAINIKTGETVGFSRDFFDVKKILRDLLADDSKIATTEPATYVNQYRYRGTNGRSFNCNFWFNSGSLPGNVLIQQFIRVVIHCEMVGSRVFGFVCDAGGNQGKLTAMLREDTDVPEDVGWISEDCVRTLNPYDPSRYIYLFPCSTHGVKAFRNQLFTSCKEGKKAFLDENDVRVGKLVVTNCHKREEERASRDAPKLSDIRESTVNLTRWSKMNVAEAKAVFSWKTLCEMSVHLYNRLGIDRSDILKEQQEGSLGYMSKVADHLYSLANNDNEAVAKDEWLKPEIASFKFVANVHEIFNALLNNMDQPLHHGNIER